MSLFISALNSGSNGNCYYIGSSEEAILIDAGISCRETEKRLKRSGLDISRIRAIFISHEHKDHISGVQVLSNKHRIPVYINEATLRESKLQLDAALIHSFDAEKPVTIGNLHITCFPKFHDAADPCSFVVEKTGIRVGIFTDLGIACEKLIHYFSTCHAAFLESNYDEEMLEKGSYPYHLKKRISGGLGHLSNRQAFELVRKYKPDYMSHLLLSHLSQNNNCPDLVYRLFNEHRGNTCIVVASRFEETPVYCIDPVPEKPAIPGSGSRLVKTAMTQLSLFV